jgi:hypothetical protein
MIDHESGHPRVRSRFVFGVEVVEIVEVVTDAVKNVAAEAVGSICGAGG